MKEIVGIIGGMGSYACSSIFQNLLKASKAKEDQDFPEIILHNNVKIPDRNASIVNGTQSPINEMVRSLKFLEACGATKIIIGCISAHAFYNELCKNVNKAKIINVVEEARKFILERFPDKKNIGIICSRGTKEAEIWQKTFDDNNMTFVFLTNDKQKTLFDDTVFGDEGIKAGYFGIKNKKKIESIIYELKNLGADLVLGSCSELQLVLKSDFNNAYIDVFEILTQNIINEYYLA